jgi:alpha-methylacyl-CoA racemase
MYRAMLASGLWSAPRGSNLFDGGAPFYRCYRTSDDRWVAVGAIELPFYERLLDGLGLEPELAATQHDPSTWADTSRRFAEVFATRSRDAWAEVFAGRDACVAPVLSAAEAVDDPHLAARATYLRDEAGTGPVHPAAAPRFSATPARRGATAREPGQDTSAVLSEIGWEDG